MGIGDAFLGATLLADALASALDADPTQALTYYQRELKERTYSVFEYTPRAAALPDPASQAPLYARIARLFRWDPPAHECARRHVALPSFFDRENLSRLIGRDRDEDERGASALSPLATLTAGVRCHPEAS
jgi:2-polyprenyl-6-methoxyphenol hydroxylase-like FAD-dependent oxidoreductase